MRAHMIEIAGRMVGAICLPHHAYASCTLYGHGRSWPLQHGCVAAQGWHSD